MAEEVMDYIDEAIEGRIEFVVGNYFVQDRL